jgi:hypothetical protein
MKTEVQCQTDAREGASANSGQPSRAGPDSQLGIAAVIVERGDRTCALFNRGLTDNWPSIDEAKAAVEKVSARVVWRETTRGVWVARVDGREPLISDRRRGGARRAEPAKTAKTSTPGDTFLTAHVLRGKVRPG